MPDYSSREEIEIPLSQISLDILNPRVIINGDITQEKIIDYLINYFDVINLANSINDSCGLPPADKVVCIKEEDHYVVVEGNRRIAACKILSNLNNIFGVYKNKLNKVNENTLKNINKIRICLAPSRDEAEPYITLRHSDYGIKKWSTLAQVQRVMQRYILGATPKQIAKILELKTSDVEKSIKFYNFLEYVKNKLDWSKKELEIISDPLLETTKLDRFLPFSSKAKSILCIDFDKNYNLIIGVKEDNAKKALKTIISNIYIYNIYNTRTKLEEVFNDDIVKLCEEKENNSNNKNTYILENPISNQDNIIILDKKTNNTVIETTNFNEKNNKTNNTNKAVITDTKNDDSVKKYAKIESESPINPNNISDAKGIQKSKRNPKPANFFDNFKWTKLNKDDSFENGIISLCKELKELSKTKDYKKYPISTGIIMRSILENSLIYYAKKNGSTTFLNKIQRKNNGDILIGYRNLDDIIKTYANDAKQGTKDDSSIFYNKETLLRYFNTFTSSTGTKSYLNMIIHQPGNIIANSTALESIADSGFKAFIEEILN